ncbi:sterile alpha motif domain-containing protein 9-like [Carassius auratus]|uniref:Sterile alpha motif domain-containing protein 9-like n=1 Tax=Carassius auratus TaxID=7957 RepID=A0A6P6MVM3_CARAU|nr:sterile alpha motif domain-containing protein 9-like [Carassius auratus]XP_026100407.1 sterile alpha motif domain-containing protein 9-like [Carassius auratus]XP_026100408.1 sterile alpha motif domain-containing protein 9-like [Carassius auratus]
MDVWKKDDVRKWLIKNKVPEEYAKILYDQDVYGAALIHFGEEDLLKLVSNHGPAVHIYNIVAQFKTSPKNSEKHTALPRDTDASVVTSTVQHFQQEKVAAESPSTESAQLEIPAQISIEENRYAISSVKTWSISLEDKPKYTGSGGKSPVPFENALLLEEQNNGMHNKEDEASCAQSPALHLTQCTKQTNNMGSETKAHLFISENPEDISASFELQYCTPRPFDKSSETFVYIQDDILPPETGPGNLIDPLHEYKLMANTENASEEAVFKKFRNETFRFAAACMNTRTNGTIHFGVGDEPLYKHGQIIGLEVPSRDKYVDEFDKGLQEHFKGKSNIAMTCIRPPKFVKVKCPGNKDKWVIEIDVVPKYKLTQKKLFYTTLDKKKKKSKCLFIRSGASTINYLPEDNLKIFKQNSKNLKKDLELWALARELAEEDIANLRMCYHQCICSRDPCQWCVNSKVVHQP